MYGLINHASAYSCNRSTTWTALSAEAFDKWQRILDLGNVYSVIQEEHTASFFDKIRKECRRLAHAGIGYHRTKEAAQTFVYCLFWGGGVCGWNQMRFGSEHSLLTSQGLCMLK